MSQNTEILLRELNHYLQCYWIDAQGNRIEANPIPPIINGLSFGINLAKSAFVMEFGVTQAGFSIPVCNLLEGSTQLTEDVIARTKAFYRKNESRILEELNSLE